MNFIIEINYYTIYCIQNLITYNSSTHVDHPEDLQFSNYSIVQFLNNFSHSQSFNYSPILQSLSHSQAHVPAFQA